MKAFLLNITFVLLTQIVVGQNIFVSRSNGSIYKINPTNCTSTLIGTGPTYVDIAFLPNGKLYGQTWGAIFEVDTNTAANVQVVTGGSGNSLVGAPNGKLYSVQGNSLKEIDVVAGTITTIGTVNCSSGGDLAYFNGSLYLACSNNDLLKIDVGNPGASYSVGNMNITGAAYGLVNNVNGCTENPYVISSNGDMYPLDYSNGSTGAPCTSGVPSSIYGAAAINEFASTGGPTNLLGPDTTYCNKSSHTFTIPPQPNTSILWSDNSTANTFTVNANGKYWVRVTDNAIGCVIHDTINIAFINSPVNDTSIKMCAKGLLNLPDSVNTPNVPITWVDNNFNPIAFPINMNTLGTFDYYYLIASPCEDTAKVTVQVLFDQLSIGNDSTICSNQQVPLSANLTGMNYTWSNGSTSQTNTVNTTGIYDLIATASGCTFYDTVSITVKPTPNAGLDGTITQCDFIGSDLFLSINGMPDNGGNWIDPNLNPFNQPITSNNPVDGNYQYIVTNGTCSDTSTVTLTNIVPDLSGFIYDEERIIAEQTLVTFTQVSIADASSWLVNGLPVSTNNSFTQIFNQKGIVPVCLIINTDNCIDTICEPITIIEDAIIFVPNSFTPDNDGSNDHFKPAVNGVVNDYEFYVFNRWGEIIYQTNQVEDSWDGTYDKNIVQSGIYTWRITYSLPSEGGKKDLNGHIQVIR